MCIDDEDRTILLDLTVDMPRSNGRPLLLQLQPVIRSNYYIKFRYSDIYRITFDHTQSSTGDLILFQLKSPVSYEYADGMTAIMTMFGSDRRPMRNRLSSLTFDPQHKELAAFVSKNLLVQLTHQDAQQFKELCKLAKIGHIRRGSIYQITSEIFSESVMTPLRQWISKKEWEVAFQVSI
jgi:hypothetical protein